MSKVKLGTGRQGMLNNHKIHCIMTTMPSWKGRWWTLYRHRLFSMECNNGHTLIILVLQLKKIHKFILLDLIHHQPCLCDPDIAVANQSMLSWKPQWNNRCSTLSLPQDWAIPNNIKKNKTKQVNYQRQHCLTPAILITCPVFVLPPQPISFSTLIMGSGWRLLRKKKEGERGKEREREGGREGGREEGGREGRKESQNF